MKTSVISYIDKHTVFGVETTEALKDYFDPLYAAAYVGDIVVVFTDESTSQWVITEIANDHIKAKKVWEIELKGE